MFSRRAATALCFVLAFAQPVLADDLSRFSLIEENDSLWFKSDQHYTQGGRFAELGPDLQPGSAWNLPFALFDLFGRADQENRRYSVEIGQSIFTPTDRYLAPPDPRDRPYAGYAYAGVHLLQEDNGHSLEDLEIQLGLVGPDAQGKLAQNSVHFLIHAQPFYGWKYQISNQAAGDISYDRYWRVKLLGDMVDWVPSAGLTGGNVLDYAQIGSLIRIGFNLGTDYGPARIRPALSGTDYVNADNSTGALGGYFFFGAQGRAVARNIFLDGDDNSGPHIDKVPLVADLEAGATFFVDRGLRLDLMAMRRSVEYVGQPHPDVLCTVGLAWAW